MKLEDNVIPPMNLKLDNVDIGKIIKESSELKQKINRLHNLIRAVGKDGCWCDEKHSKECLDLRGYFNIKD